MENSANYLRESNNAIYVLLFISTILSGYAIVEIINEPLGETGWYSSIVIWSSVWMMAYLIAAWRTFRHIYLFSTAYLIALVMFHLGLLYQRTLGDIKFPNAWEHGWFSPWLENAGWHIVLALSAFGIGFAIASFTGKNYLKEPDPQLVIRIKEIGQWSAKRLLITSFFFFLLALYSYGNLLDYARHEIFAAQVDSRGLGVFMMIFPGSVLLYYFSALTKNQKFLGLMLTLFAFFMFMATGSRSPALFPALVGVALWVKSGRRIPLSVAVGGVFLVLILIAASGYLRTMGKYSELRVTDVSKALGEASVESSLSEMGSSVKALANVLELVPKKDGYRFGGSYIAAIIDSIPNISLNINSAASREEAMQKAHTDPDAIRRMQPSNWLTYRTEPWAFAHGGGVGFSAIAEPFLNFGSAGVFFCFIGIGFGLGRLDSIPIFQSPRIFIFNTTMLWYLVTTVRNDSPNFFKPVIFTFLILVAWLGFSKIFLGNKMQWDVSKSSS